MMALSDAGARRRTRRTLGGLLAIFLGSAALGDEQADESWWSLQPVKRPAVPEVKQSSWVRNPIDLFVLAKLEKHGLKPAPEADGRTLSRRIHFNVVGLPPEPGAKADLDALLSSPHYGERWARHWLDVARYGESNGFEYDQLRPNAWPYRDWVIKALNDDMPYDRFAKLQIAGDVLEPGNPDSIIATGFLVCGAFDGLKPSGDKQRKIMREDEMEDLVGTVGQTFLGLTVHCARCHDHKFDPIKQKEYFQMASALAGVHRGDRNVPARGDASKLQAELEALGKKLADADAEVRKRILQQTKRNPPKQLPPQPIASWDFEKDLRDQIGSMHGKAHGTARVEGGALVLDGNTGFVTTTALAKNIKERTLEAWVQLSNLKQRGGGVITIQDGGGVQFDSIVYAEKEPNRWMSGSSGYSRTKNFGVGEHENEAGGKFVHVAIVYGADGSITGYRNGSPYGKTYQTGVHTYQAGNGHILFGMRHGTGVSKGRMLAGRVDRARLYDRALTAEEIALSADVRVVTEQELVAVLHDEQKQTREAWKREIGRLTGELANMKQQKVYAVTPKGAPVRHLLIRGSPFEKGEEVAAGAVAAVRNALPSEFGLKPNESEGQRRKMLAEWIAHPDNPLFARVMMNRLWHYHFGQGLVKTPNDLGFSGGTPSHPELLDWLAAEFRKQGWSLKKMHRLILDSATWRQSSARNGKAMEVDADNVLLWRFQPARIEAEVVRDAILKVSGSLNSKAGGPGFRDFKMYNHKGSWVYDPIDPDGAEFNRRSIYRTWARGSIHPLLSPLDCPDPSSAAPVRSVTTTPLGALSLMNTSFVLRMSDNFANRLEQEAGKEAKAQARRGIELAFSRPATKQEVAITSDFISRNGLSAFCRVLFNSNEFLYVN